MTLPDGTVIPSYLGATARGSLEGSTAILNDNVLRLGEVKKIVYPNDPLSYGKKVIEYEVEVQHRDGNGIYVTSTFRGATFNTLFGGTADKFHATLRPDTSGTSSGVGNGSKVLLLCLNGDQQKAIILGGVHDPNDGTEDSGGANGHHLEFEFNGIRFKINNDGEASLFFRGATAANHGLRDGVNSGYSGTEVKIAKDGTFSVLTLDTNGNDQHKVTLNNTSGDIEVKTEGNVKVEADSKLDVKAADGFHLDSANGGMFVDLNDQCVIHSSGVQVGAATDAWMLGTTYRNDESICNSQITQGLTQIQVYLNAAAAFLTSASIANMVPCVGGIPAAPLFGGAVAQLELAANTITELTTAIQTFESKAPDHTSKVNTSD
jgi:hypothetical protein